MSAPPETSAAAELQRLYRRICLLRATERVAEAVQLEESELPAAVAAARAHGGDDSMITVLRLSAEARVAETRELAELLAPMLAKSLNGFAGVASNLTSFRAPAASRRAPSASITTGPAKVPSVADLIDGMLAQEQA